ncbi:hypothetical protein JTE90_027047 [Oedothorax gibbosus]|uniref:DUF4371 domain-containing protein n=1 Tax=Oedothorax gibbosus TaxID=931172 RepID=A0AAV6TUN7_9ARAC|nr:hypothetical protein JTE90_027047 [Oedothorax gibbosus]
MNKYIRRGRELVNVSDASVVNETSLPASEFASSAAPVANESSLPASEFASSAAPVANESSLPAPEYASSVAPVANESSLPASEFASSAAPVANESSLPASEFASSVVSVANESSLPASEFASSVVSVANESSHTAPEFALSTELATNESSLHALEFALPAEPITNESSLPAPSAAPVANESSLHAPEFDSSAANIENESYFPVLEFSPFIVSLENKSSSEPNYNDPAMWPQVNDCLREYFSRKTPNQNIEFITSSKKFIGDKERMCSIANFSRVKKKTETSDQALCKDGYSDWRNVSKRLHQHENSEDHRAAVFSFSQRSAAANRIDCSFVEQQEEECRYWEKVLTRVVAVIKFISQRGLSIFGENETIGSAHNGNFLGILELLSTFDPILAGHINKYGNKGKGVTNYLSSTIVSELVAIMSRKVLEVIIQQVHQAKYFGLIVDSTPDISHIDQLAIVLRYVDTDGDAVERFLTFHAIHNHTSSHLHDVIVEYLKSLNIDLKYCRGQSYDNASNMSGKYSGLQARLKEDNHLIEYVPCSAHSLNLVGTNAAECCSSAVSFFGIVQTLYNFFSGSTHRWELLKEQMKNETRPITLKSTSTTRWSANADAVKALKKNFSAIGNVLCAISNNPEENLSTRHDAKSLFGSIKTFEFALMLIIWDAILQRINKSNISLQKVNCEISTIISLYESLVAFIQKVREEFDMYEVEAAKLAFTKEYTSKRKRNTPKSKYLDESSSTGVSLSDREKFLYETHNVLCDAIISELNKRKKTYSSLDTRFGFLTSKNMGTYEIQKAAKNFQEISH